VQFLKMRSIFKITLSGIFGYVLVLVLVCIYCIGMVLKFILKCMVANIGMVYHTNIGNDMVTNIGIVYHTNIGNDMTNTWYWYTNAIPIPYQY
jgi:hypothetical protein